MKKLFTLSLLAVAALTGANAADFPIKDKPVTIVVPFTAGGPTDRVARDLAEAMRKPLGANVVVENVAGAGGTIGANKVAKAPQDGHTVMWPCRCDCITSAWPHRLLCIARCPTTRPMTLNTWAWLTKFL
jgi:tripartite-type tricarboxylate transporter receptor subunit TctC